MSRRKLIPLNDEKLLGIIMKIRKGDYDKNIDLIDDFCNAVGDRKVLLKYFNSHEEKYISLNKKFAWKLRSFFIENGNDGTSEYLKDVFVDNIYNIELYTVSEKK